MRKIVYGAVKKTLCFVFLFFVISLHCQNVNLIPQVVYVGDEAEIRFGFKWDGDLFSPNSESIVSMVTSSTIDESLENDYTVKSMQLFPSQDGYVLSVLFIPWKTGVLDMAAFDLATIFELETNTLLVDIPEIYIESILSESNGRNIKPPAAPVIIPGTTYALIAIVVLILMLCIASIIIFARIGLIKVWLRSFFGKIWASDNFKKASRELIILSKQAESIDSKVFAAKLSIIIRTYLEGRFSHRFTAETTSSFFIIFDTLFAGTASDKANSFLQSLYEVCARCDFLHYAGSAVEKAPLTHEEIESLIDITRKAIIYFEKETDEEDASEGASA